MRRGRNRRIEVKRKWQRKVTMQRKRTAIAIPITLNNKSTRIKKQQQNYNKRG